MRAHVGKMDVFGWTKSFPIWKIYGFSPTLDESASILILE